jgi:hypothetical protein
MPYLIIKKHQILLVLIIFSLVACNNDNNFVETSTFIHQPAVDYKIYGKKIIIDSSSVTVDGISLELLYYCKYDFPESPEKGMHIEAALKESGNINYMAIYRKTAEDDNHFISWSNGNAATITGGKDFFKGIVIYLFDPKQQITNKDESLKLATHTFVLENIDFPIPLYPERGAIHN